MSGKDGMGHSAPSNGPMTSRCQELILYPTEYSLTVEVEVAISFG
jgi:hypothetical protein